MKQTAVGAVGETSCFQFRRPSQIQPNGDYIFTYIYLSEGEKQRVRQRVREKHSTEVYKRMAKLGKK